MIQSKVKELENDNRLVLSGSTLRVKDYWNERDNEGKRIDTLWIDLPENTAGTSQLSEILGNTIFSNPKPIELIKRCLEINYSEAIVLDFFAGSGTTGHAVMDLNTEDNGNRTFLLCQLNEATELTPNGIAYDVTSKRLKRIMTGKCYDGTNDFEWIKKNTPYGGNLDVYELADVANFESTEGKTPFDVIDETLYGTEKFKTIKEKIDWVCQNFDKTQKYLE